MESIYYQRIQQMPGMEEVKKVVEQWRIFSKNVGKMPPELPILLPEYMIFSPPGTGKSSLFQWLANYNDGKVAWVDPTDSHSLIFGTYLWSMM